MVTLTHRCVNLRKTFAFFDKNAYFCNLKPIHTPDMRQFIIAIMMLGALPAIAQGTWERPEQQQVNKAKANEHTYQYAYCLGDVVPVVNGEVRWEKTFNNSKTADENYAAMLDLLTAMTKDEGQLKESVVSLVNREERKIVCHFEEWLTFKNTFLALDRTRFIYTLMAECKNQQVKVTIFRISYWYEEQRNGGSRFKAEEWITDENALNKKHTKLAKISGKFRVKTVDRVQDIFDHIGSGILAQ